MNWQMIRARLASRTLAFVAVLLAVQAGAAELKWLTSLPEAQEQAQKEKKLVLMNFTGSDWCPWCVKLKKEVFSTPEFSNYAVKNLVLVEVDFPRIKKLPPEQKKANEALQLKHRAEGFPTIVVLNSAGKEAWKQTGNMPDNPKAFITLVESGRKK